jgi:penicillin-binding protein 1B
VQARRQVGSLFKPFVALAALDKFTPATRLSNAPKTYEVANRKWEPKNYSETSELEVSMRRAIQQSYNRATVDLAMKTGLEHIIDCMEPFEFSTPLKPYPSMALGSFEMILLEIARAYCVLAADGALSYPLSVKKVVDESGVLLEQRHMNIHPATSPQKAFLITDLLRSVVDGGTAKSLRDKGIYFPVAAKTGTTNDYKDAWFVGYTPDILALVWVGFDNGDPIGLSGGMAALPIWADLMAALPQHVSEKWFKAPDGVVRKTICQDSGRLARSGCPYTLNEYFLSDNPPEGECNLHGEQNGFETLYKRILEFGK